MAFLRKAVQRFKVSGERSAGFQSGDQPCLELTLRFENLPEQAKLTI
jgi:hypothetical protein